MRSRLGVLSCLLLSSCTVDLSLPGGSLISCTTDEECPPDQRCSQSLERCVPEVANQAPSVVIAPVARSAGVTSLRITLFDEEANDITLAARLVVGGRFIELTLPETFASAPEGVAYTLPVSLGDVLGSAAFVDAVAVELTPRDATGIGATVASEPFAFGNDAPVLTQLQLSGEGGVLAVSIDVADSSGDAAAVAAFEYSLDGFASATTVTLDATNFDDLSLLDQIVTTGATHTFYWNTAPLGLMDSVVSVRCKVRDGFGAESNWLASSPRTIDNAPTLALLGVPASERALQAIDFVVDAFDPNVPLRETLRLELTYANLADPTPIWRPVTLAPGYPVNPFALGRQTLRWDALDQTDDAPMALTLPASVSGAPPTPTRVLDYMGALAIRAQLVDSAGLASSTETLVVGEVGNNAPSASVSFVPSAAAYQVPISIALEDSSSDPADLEVEFKTQNDAAFRKAALVLSNTSGLATSPSGVTHLVLWDSTAEPSTDPEVPQGVGFNVTNQVEVRVRARDQAGGGSVDYYGAWSVPAQIAQITNQTPPRIDSVSIERLIDSDGSSPVAIRYVLIDAESDPADVGFDISIDGGPFGPCPEYPSPLSEDTREQMSSPQGVEHVFVWNPTADRVRSAGAIELRIRARDAKLSETNANNGEPNVDAQTQRLLPRPAQAEFTSRYTLNDPGAFNYQETAFFLESGDINGDRLTDLVLSLRRRDRWSKSIWARAREALATAGS
jgi:hypothetical protein